MFGDLFAQAGKACVFVIVGDPLIDFVADDCEVVAEGDGGDFFDVGAIPGSAGGVAGGIADDGAGSGGDCSFDLVRVRAESVFDGCGDDDDFASSECDLVGVGHPEGGE